MPTPTLDYEQPTRKWRSRRVLSAVAATLLLYPASYVVLRATHVIVHYRDMEGDTLAPAVGTRLPGLPLFTPLMRLEDKLWYRGDRRPG